VIGNDVDLFIVRTEWVPLEQLEEGDLLILPSGMRVTVERVDEFDDGFVVRWWRVAAIGEPGHKGRQWNRPEAFSDAMDGRYLGSTLTVPAGTPFEVDRG
jgi:hypothetical protein